ncbi:MAG: hypothetical protein P1U57_02280 [Oleibacter sp.]|nr:hypothetical protein [Thalassolituus sp.]
MKLITEILTIYILSYFLVGCGEPTLDTSSKESLKSSLNIMSEKLPKDKAEELRKNVQALVSLYGLKTMVKGQSEQEFIKAISKELDGKTADEIFKLSADIKKDFRNSMGGK